MGGLVMVMFLFQGMVINHMTMSLVVMLANVSFSGMRLVGPGYVSGQDTLLKVASTYHFMLLSPSILPWVKDHFPDNSETLKSNSITCHPLDQSTFVCCHIQLLCFGQ